MAMEKKQLFRAREKGTWCDLVGYLNKVKDNGSTKYFITITADTMAKKEMYGRKYGTYEVDKKTIVKTDKSLFDWYVELCTKFLKKFTESSKTYHHAGSQGLKSYTESYFSTYIDEDAMVVAGKALYESTPLNSRSCKFRLKLNKEYLKLRRWSDIV